MSGLLKESLQAKILTLKHFLEKNLKVNNVNSVVTFLDNAVATSDIVEDIHILNNRGKLVYSSDRDKMPFHPNVQCENVANIFKSDIFKQGCYNFGIRLFDGLEPYYYHVYVYMDHKYISELVNGLIKKYTLIFTFFVILFILFMWYLLRNFLITPLEKLRQYAYYSTKEPEEFIIQELESIRRSLVMTFDRLKREQEELYRLSTQDSLSGLYNRLSLIEKMDWLISKGHRSKTKFAVIFVDLDNFKNINDSRGHDFGDVVLQKVSQRLIETVRENDIVSRFGGDEFVIVVPELEDETLVVDIVERIREKLSIPIEHEGFKYPVTASMGIAIYPKDGSDVSTLLKNADIAMYKSKEIGKNTYHFYTESLNKIIQEKMHIQKLMLNAMQNDHFRLFYQPKVDIRTNRIVGCEALIRLIDPKEGLIPPDKFISVAESNGFIIPLGRWIIEEATRQIAKWQDTELKNVKLSINISGVQFQDKTLIRTLKNSVAAIDASKLDIELTESVLMSNFEEKLEVINKIRKFGISFSLDDFGTGYSSLSYLKNIPFNTLKIDKSFIDDLQNQKDQSFVNMIISIAKNLELEVVAEGVETKEQLDYLKRIGCDLYQGYYCSKPLPVEEFEALFKTMQCNASE